MKDTIQISSDTYPVMHGQQRQVLRQLAQEALAVQDACNLSGVAHGFARAMGSLRSLGLDTNASNRHPIALLWIDKMASLSGYPQSAIWEVYEECQRLAKGDQ